MQVRIPTDPSTAAAQSLLRRLRLCALALIGALLAQAALAAAAPAHTGGWRLAEASSPYLRMHADNPVEWFPWGDEAFEKAKREHKPLFISIGYFTCHWCHVMARESFQNPRIAELLNQYFVSIKIDREQRPDIDAAYMAFVTLTRGAGGWPMTVFATPQGYPFTGGVYFPPETRDGHIGLRELVTRVHALWQEDPTQIQAAAAAAVAQIRKLRQTSAVPTGLDPKLPEKARSEFRHSYDPLAGGFGEAPKFPQVPQLLFLLQSPSEPDRDMALHTLEAMADGGIRDQLGGGFHRYATDPLWRVPHFEKMLYDQALNARAYLRAWRVGKRRRYADVARETLDFVLANMRAGDGSFYAAYAADSLPPGAGAAAHPQEGAFYVWDWAQWQRALAQESLRELAAAYYGVRENGNVEATGEATLAGSNVLYQASSPLSLAMQGNRTVGEIEAELGRAKALLRRAREQRPSVPLDTKVVAAWNGYMITALAEAGIQLQAPHYLAAATRAAEALVQRLYEAKTRRLYRDYSDGRRGSQAFAIDYAALCEAMLTLYSADPNPRWLDLARRLNATQLELFWDAGSGGFFNNQAGSAVWLRDKESEDGVEPGVNAISIGNLIALARYDDSPQLLRRARRTAVWLATHLAAVPSAMPYALMQWPALIEADNRASAPAQSRRQ